MVWVRRFVSLDMTFDFYFFIKNLFKKSKKKN